MAPTLSDALKRPCRDVGRVIPLILLQESVTARTAPITLEDPSREYPSCGDQVSTAQTTVLPANVRLRYKTTSDDGQMNNVKKGLINDKRLDNGIFQEALALRRYGGRIDEVNLTFSVCSPRSRTRGTFTGTGPTPVMTSLSGK